MVQCEVELEDSNVPIGELIDLRADCSTTNYTTSEALDESKSGEINPELEQLTTFSPSIASHYKNWSGDIVCTDALVNEDSESTLLSL